MLLNLSAEKYPFAMKNSQKFHKFKSQEIIGIIENKLNFQNDI